MKRKYRIPGIFVTSFTVLGILLLSVNSIFAQCDNYFKTNYRAITPLNTGGFPNQEVNEELDDWTGDGKSDFWNLHWTGNTFDVVIYPRKPAGYWDWDNPITYTTPFSNFGSDYIVADFDADGRRDLFFDKHIYRNTGNGSLVASPEISDTGLVSNSTIGFADINGDNLLDWVYFVYIANSSEIRYKLQNQDGSFGSPVTILASSAQNGLFSSNKMLGDFNGDSRIDIIYSTVINSANKYVLIKNLGGSFQVDAPVAADLYVGLGSVARDYNNDGRADIFSRTGALAIFYGQADGSFNRIPLTAGSGAQFTAELNGDNNLDILEIGSDYYATNIGNGAGGFTRTVYPRSLQVSGFMRLEDFSGDGKADIFDMRPLNQRGAFNIFGEQIITIKENSCLSAGETKMANFDGNVKTDVAMWNPNTGVWSSKNTGWFPDADPNTRTFNWGLGALGDIPAPGDFDGDGKTDYAVYRNITGQWYIFKSSDSSWMVIPFGLTGDVAVPNDYDGGGLTDIAVFRPADGNWYLWFSETQQFSALHFGASGDKPVPADYDGDGKTDVAIYRPSEGNWYYLKSLDGNYAVIHWGIPTDIPLPADYDGDGRADLTIFRSGTWWVLRSSNNSVSVVTWGTTGDIPMPVYRNQVSADMELYRPANNLWFSFDYRNSPGFALGGSGAVPVYFGLPNN